MSTPICLVIRSTPCFAYSITGYQCQETRELVGFVVSAAEEIENVDEWMRKEITVF